MKPARPGGARATPLAADGRSAAAQVLLQVFTAGARLDDALASAQAGLPERRERALCKALATGVVRASPRLDALLERLLSRPLSDAPLRVVLLLGLHQLSATRVPPHAAVSTSVELARSFGLNRASGLVNGVLRRFSREQAQLLQATDTDAAARNAQPRWLYEAFASAWPDALQALLDASNAPAPLTLRLAPGAGSPEHYQARLAAAGVGATCHPHAPRALQLDEGIEPTTLPGFDDGLVSVQDASSQLLVEVLGATGEARVLDACAAPGGKAAALLENAPGLRLTALDSSSTRRARMAENFRRLGLPATPCAGDALHPAQWWDGEPFEYIVLDAPCTATGVIRRHPDIKLRRRSSDVARFAAQQLALLHALWPTLARGGTLVYATCSVLPVENADVVGAFLASQDDACEQPIQAAWGRPMSAGRQILPGETGMDGFYYARIRKT